MRTPTADDALDLLAIERVQRRYGDVVTRRAWPELDDLFEPGAPISIDTRTRPVIEVAGAEELAGFVGPAIERFAFFEFTILNTLADLGPLDGEATGRVYLCEVRWDPEEGWSYAYGVYDDRYRRGPDGAWRIAARRYHSLGRRLADGGGEAFPFPT